MSGARIHSLAQWPTKEVEASALGDHFSDPPSLSSLMEAISLRIDPVVWNKFFKKGNKYGKGKKKKKKKRQRLEEKVSLLL